MTERTYRLSAPDRTGLILGLSASQLSVVVVGLLVTVLAVNSAAPIAWSVLPTTMAVLVAFIPVGNQPLIDRMPIYLGWTLRRASSRTWFARIPTLPEATSPALPPPLEHQRLLDVVPADYAVAELSNTVAVIHDIKTDYLAATVRVSGRQFALVEREQQDRLLQLWGQCLAAFAQHSSAIVAVRWAEWAAPGGIEEQISYVHEHIAANADGVAVAHYESLLASAGPMATSHEVLVTVVVSARRVRKSTVKTKSTTSRLDGAINNLLRQIVLFTDRMQAAELNVSQPLTPIQWARAMRVRLDPLSLPGINRRDRTTSESGSVVRVVNAGPLAAQVHWGHWRVDGALHRCFYVSDWPRLELPSSWMQELVLYGATVRSLAMHYEPVSFRASTRAVVRESAKLESDQDQRHRAGFRIGAAHRRAAEAVNSREEELTSGYAELTYAGIVQVSACDVDALERATEEIIQLAASSGIELRSLDGRHDQAMAACLPVAVGLTPKRAF